MGSVTRGLGADISLPPCLSVRPGIWKFSVFRLKATSGPNEGTVTRSTFFFYDQRMRTTLLGQMRRGLLFSLTCSTAARQNIGRLKIFQIREISNSTTCFLTTNFAIVKKEIQNSPQLKKTRQQQVGADQLSHNCSDPRHSTVLVEIKCLRELVWTDLFLDSFHCN